MPSTRCWPKQSGGAWSGIRLAARRRSCSSTSRSHTLAQAAFSPAAMHQGRANLNHGGYLGRGIECEIAVRLGRDLSPADAPFTADKVAEAVESYMPAIEVVDERYADWPHTEAPTLIADDFFAAGCVLGAPTPRGLCRTSRN